LRDIPVPTVTVNYSTGVAPEYLKTRKEGGKEEKNVLTSTKFVLIVPTFEPMYQHPANGPYSVFTSQNLKALRLPTHVSPSIALPFHL
jgi:hypothetical protein